MSICQSDFEEASFGEVQQISLQTIYPGPARLRLNPVCVKALELSTIDEVISDLENLEESTAKPHIENIMKTIKYKYGVRPMHRSKGRPLAESLVKLMHKQIDSALTHESSLFAGTPARTSLSQKDRIDNRTQTSP